jgi:hypothetical protein
MMPQDQEWMKNKLGFLVHMEEGSLVLTLDQEFIDTCGTGKWGPLVFSRYPGPHKRVILDMSHCKIIQSTLFAKMLHIRDLFHATTTDGIYLRSPSQRVKTVLDIMQIGPLFKIIP